MPVKYVKSMDEFKSIMEVSNSQLVVIDFTATWCGPCRFIAPVFEKLSDEMTDVVFVKIDVDEAQDVAAQCEITAMPTFQFYRKGTKIDEMRGANENGLRDMLNKHK